MKLHNISVTPKLVKKVITNLKLSKASGPDCIQVVVLGNCEPKLSYILAELFIMCLKESWFSNCWKKSHLWSVYLGMLQKVVLLKAIALLVLSSMGNKVFGNLVYNRLLDYKRDMLPFL